MPTPPYPGSETSSPKRVLVIDDSDIARDVMRRLLEPAGYAVFELASAIGATSCIIGNEVHAVVVDVSMPGLSGDRLVRVLRDNAKLSGLVIVVVSAKDERELSRIAAVTPANAVLSKNDLERELVPTLRRHLAPSATLAVRQRT